MRASRCGPRLMESRYAQKLCIALVSLVLHFAEQFGLQRKARSLADVEDHPLRRAQFLQIETGGQPRPSKLP